MSVCRVRRLSDIPVPCRGCSALAGLNARVAALQAVPLEGLEEEAAQQLRQRLQALADKRQQLDAMAARLAQLTKLSEAEAAPPEQPSPATGQYREAPSPSYRSLRGAPPGFWSLKRGLALIYVSKGRPRPPKGQFYAHTTLN